MWSKEFWKAVAERAAKTFIQVASGFLFVDGVVVSAGEVNWQGLGWTLLVTTALSVGTSILSALGDGNPSATNAERLAVAPPRLK